MQNGKEYVDNGKVVVAKAGSAFQKIADAVGELTTHAEDILADAKAGAETAGALVELMESINVAGHGVSNEAGLVSSATRAQALTMDKIAATGKKLAELAGELTASTSKFKI